jgi:ribonuclease HII
MIAKTMRDQQMMDLHVLLPQYGFDKHKGYCHVSHKLAIAKYGMTEYHRKSFRMELTEKEKRQLNQS